MTPTAKSLIVDLLSTLRRGSMPVRALVSAAELFGIPENNLRVALARLRARGTVERDERGRYRLGTRAEATRREVAAWRRRHEAIRPWDGRIWVGLLSPAAKRHPTALTRALRLLGFRKLLPGLDIRPDNLEGGIALARERLFALDPSLAKNTGCLVLGVTDLDGETEKRARSLWDAAAAAGAYEASLVELAESEGRLASGTSISRRDRMVESFLIGGRILRQIALDPLLPEEIVPAAPRTALVERMKQYDELGRAHWAEFLAGFGVPHLGTQLRTPVDLRVAEAPLEGVTVTSGEAA